MRLIFALQLTLPLLFIAWIGFAPARNRLVFCIQVTAAAVALFAVSLTGLWLFPPWWASWVFYPLLLAAVVMGWSRRSTGAPQLPARWMTWLSTAVLAAVGVGGAYQSVMALAGRALQPGAVVDLAFPIKGGNYLVVNGGSNISINAHMVTLDPNVPRFHAYKGQSYGVDIVELGGFGLRANGLLPPQPSAYKIYGAAVYAPCAGEVLAALDGLPDMQVPQVDRDHMAGNHVLLRCKQADVLLGHLKPGSLKVVAGTRVTAGHHIGNVGNSGNTGEPHLHIHAQLAGTATEPLSGTPLPIRLNGRFLVRNDRIAID